MERIRASSWLAVLALLLGVAGVSTAGPVEVDVATRVAAPPERVLAVLADFDAWDRIFRSIRVVRAEQQDERTARIRQETEQVGRTLVYTLRATVDPDAGRLDLELDPSEPHDVERLESRWSVAPHPDGGSRVELRVVTESGAPVPTFIERLVVERNARRSVDDLARALDDVAANGTGF